MKSKEEDKKLNNYIENEKIYNLLYNSGSRLKRKNSEIVLGYKANLG